MSMNELIRESLRIMEEKIASLEKRVKELETQSQSKRTFEDQIISKYRAAGINTNRR